MWLTGHSNPITNFELGLMMAMILIFIVLDSAILNAQCSEGD